MATSKILLKDANGNILLPITKSDLVEYGALQLTKDDGSLDVEKVVSAKNAIAEALKRADRANDRIGNVIANTNNVLSDVANTVKTLAEKPINDSDVKITGTYTDGPLGALEVDAETEGDYIDLNEALVALNNAIKAIPDDVLTESDKTSLEQEITDLSDAIESLTAADIAYTAPTQAEGAAAPVTAGKTNVEDALHALDDKIGAFEKTIDDVAKQAGVTSAEAGSGIDLTGVGDGAQKAGAIKTAVKVDDKTIEIGTDGLAVKSVDADKVVYKEATTGENPSAAVSVADAIEALETATSDLSKYDVTVTKVETPADGFASQYTFQQGTKEAVTISIPKDQFLKGVELVDDYKESEEAAAVQALKFTWQLDLPADEGETATNVTYVPIASLVSDLPTKQYVDDKIAEAVGHKSSDAEGEEGTDGYKPAETATGVYVDIEAAKAAADAAQQAADDAQDTADEAKAAAEAAQGDVDALEEVVGDSNSGLVKDIADLKEVVGDAEGGLVKDVADLKAKKDVTVSVNGGTPVVQDANGNIDITIGEQFKYDYATTDDLDSTFLAGLGLSSSDVTPEPEP